MTKLVSSIILILMILNSSSATTQLPYCSLLRQRPGLGQMSGVSQAASDSEKARLFSIIFLDRVREFWALAEITWHFFSE